MDKYFEFTQTIEFVNEFVEKIAIVDPLDRAFGENGNEGTTLEML